MRFFETVAAIFMLTCCQFVRRVHNENITCWQCSTSEDEDCGDFDKVGDHRIRNMTELCVPVGYLPRACYRTVVEHDDSAPVKNLGPSGSELRLFCGPAVAFETVCMMIGFLLGKIGNMTLTHCSVCTLPLCNSTIQCYSTINLVAATALLPWAYNSLGRWP